MMITSDVTGISQAIDLQITFSDAHIYSKVCTGTRLFHLTVKEKLRQF